jgi:hypothetical protein
MTRGPQVPEPTDVTAAGMHAGQQAAQREYARRDHERRGPGYREVPNPEPMRFGRIIEAVLGLFRGG